MTVIGYYPGCSLAGGGIELDLSVRALARLAGVELREIADWNCCGATAAHALNHDLAVALPYRVLALAEEQGLMQLVAPCAACFSRLKGTQVRLARSDELTAKMAGIVGRPYNRSVTILNINEFINLLLEPTGGPRAVAAATAKTDPTERVPPKAGGPRSVVAGTGLSEKLTAKFDGLKVAAYYGCLLSRGQDIVEGEDAERPTGMEPAIRAVGAVPVEWNFATECCGGGFSMSKTEAVVDLSDAILTDAAAAGAGAIVTGCPMCHSNLDMRQRTINAAGKRRARLRCAAKHDMPVVYLSELLCLAAGLPPEQIGLDRHYVDATRLAKGLSPFPSPCSEKGTVPLSDQKEKEGDSPLFSDDAKRGQSPGGSA